MKPYNEHGDGITVRADLMIDKNRIFWFNGFDTSVKHEEDKTYSYLATALENFFKRVRATRSNPFVANPVWVHDDAGKEIGRIVAFERNLRGEYPNLIRIGIQFYNRDLPYADSYLITPQLMGEDVDSDYDVNLTSVNFITGVVFTPIGTEPHETIPA